MSGKVAKRRITKNSKKSDNEMFRMKITLRNAPLPIWRRLVVKTSTPLLLVHDCFQITMGWWDTHAHEFQSDGIRYGGAHPDEDPRTYRNESDFTLGDLAVKAGDSFVYLYDYGDDWFHDVVVEEVHEGEGEGFVTCLGGRRACPPEDVGGPPGYKDFLDKVEDPACDEGLELLDWAGGDFDADSFDLRGVNLRLILMQQALLGIQD
jgi:hypothetical protein